jgi:hypothetical protein
MKKTYFVILITFLLMIGIIACQKDNIKAVDSTKVISTENLDNYVVFGYVGLGWGCRANVIYMIAEGKLYADSSKVFCKNQENYQFSGYQLSDNEYNKAKSVLLNFPSELANQDSQTFGCLGCADGGMILIQRKEKGKSLKTYRIDDAILRGRNSTTNEPFPDYLYNYAKDFGTLINNLNYK